MDRSLEPVVAPTEEEAAHNEAENRKRFGRWVKRLRTQRKLTQDQLAMELGKSRAWVSALEGGRFRPLVQECALIARVFGQPFDDVLLLAGHIGEWLEVMKLQYPSSIPIAAERPDWASDWGTDERDDRLLTLVNQLVEEVRYLRKDQGTLGQAIGELAGMVDDLRRAATPDESDIRGPLGALSPLPRPLEPRR